MERRRVSSGAPWEPVVGYSRAVRVGQQIFVAGTTSVGPDGTVVGRGDPYLQAREAIRTIERALEEAGGRLEDVVRTRMFVTDISQFDAFARAHGERFSNIRPAATMVEVRALIDPAMLIEIEADAVLEGPSGRARRPGVPSGGARRRERRRRPGTSRRLVPHPRAHP